MSTEPLDGQTGREADEAPTIDGSTQCLRCQRVVPLDEVVVLEAVPYLIHFCGLECYAQWRASWGDPSTR